MTKMSTMFFFVIIPIICIVLLGINLIFAPHNPYKEKKGIFECGFTSFRGQNRTQFSISFFIFGLLFLLFDLEILLVYPYLVTAYTNETYGLVIVLVFLLVLTLGFAFELGKKALRLDSKQTFHDSTKTYKAMKGINTIISHRFARLVPMYSTPNLVRTELWTRAIKRPLVESRVYVINRGLIRCIITDRRPNSLVINYKAESLRIKIDNVWTPVDTYHPGEDYVGENSIFGYDIIGDLNRYGEYKYDILVGIIEPNLKFICYRGKGQGLYPEFILRFHKKFRGLAYRILSFLGVGKIFDKLDANSTLEYRVTDPKELLHIVTVFDKCNFITDKKIKYKHFRELVLAANKITESKSLSKEEYDLYLSHVVSLKAPRNKELEIEFGVSPINYPEVYTDTAEITDYWIAGFFITQAKFNFVVGKILRNVRVILSIVQNENNLWLLNFINDQVLEGFGIVRPHKLVGDTQTYILEVTNLGAIESILEYFKRHHPYVLNQSEELTCFMQVCRLIRAGECKAEQCNAGESNAGECNCGNREGQKEKEIKALESIRQIRSRLKYTIKRRLMSDPYRNREDLIDQMRKYPWLKGRIYSNNKVK